MRPEKGKGANYSTLFREYDPLIGRWWSADPKRSLTPGESPYAGMGNNPMSNVDILGDVTYPKGTTSAPQHESASINPENGLWDDFPSFNEYNKKYPNAGGVMNSSWGQWKQNTETGNWDLVQTQKAQTESKSLASSFGSGFLDGLLHSTVLMPFDILEHIVDPGNAQTKLALGTEFMINAFSESGTASDRANIIGGFAGSLAGGYVTGKLMSPLTSGTSSLTLSKGWMSPSVTNIYNKSSTLFIGRMEDLNLLPSNYQTIINELPDLGSSKANYYQNMSVIRGKIRQGFVFKDASWFRSNSELAGTKQRPDRVIGQTFLGAERLLLGNRGLWP